MSLTPPCSGVPDQRVLPGANAAQEPTLNTKRGALRKVVDVIEDSTVILVVFRFALAVYGCIHLLFPGSSESVTPMTQFAVLFAIESVPSIALAVEYFFCPSQRLYMLFHPSVTAHYMLTPSITAVMEVLAFDAPNYVARIFTIAAVFCMEYSYCHRRDTPRGTYSVLAGDRAPIREQRRRLSSHSREPRRAQRSMVDDGGRCSLDSARSTQESASQQVQIRSGEAAR